MAVSGVRARNFIQPTPGGASAIFARQRGMMVAAAPMTGVAEGDPRQRGGRFGKATGRDYANFLGKRENTSVIKQAVNSLKNLLVGTFVAAKSLGATLKGVIEQIKGMSGGGGGGGIFKTLGMIGLVGAVIAGVAAIFGPQIKKAFEFLKGGAEGIFQDLKGKLDGLDKKIENFYTNIQNYVNVTLTGMIEKVNKVISLIKPVANKLFHLPTKIGPFDVSDFANPIKDLGKAIYAIPQIDPPPKLPSYDELLGGNGLNFLSNYATLGDLGSAMATGAGSLAMGGIENTTGFIGDIINNIIASLGLTGQANVGSNSLGMGNLFGESRVLGSGPGIPSLINQKGSHTAEQQALLDSISFAEGTTKSYGTIFGGQVVPELEKGELTIDEVHAMMMSGQVKGRSAGYKSGSSATGRYQFMPDTLRDIQKSMKLPGDTLFTNEMQDKMFLDRTENYRGVTPELLAKEGLSDKVIDMMAPEIASFPNLQGDERFGYGQSYYSNQSVKSAQDIRDAFNKSLQQQTPPPAAAPPQSAAQPAATTQTASPKPAQKVSFLNLPIQGQTPTAQRRPAPTQSPRNPGGAGNPSTPHLPAGHPDNLNEFDYGIYT